MGGEFDGSGQLGRQRHQADAALGGLEEPVEDSNIGSEQKLWRMDAAATNKNCAVMCAAWGERRKRAMAAISSAWVILLPSGIFETICCSFSSGFGKLLSHSR